MLSCWSYPTFATHAPLPSGSSVHRTRQEYWSVCCHVLPLVNLPNPEMELHIWHCSRFFTTESSGKPKVLTLVIIPILKYNDPNVDWLTDKHSNLSSEKLIHIMQQVYKNFIRSWKSQNPSNSIIAVMLIFTPLFYLWMPASMSKRVSLSCCAGPLNY